MSKTKNQARKRSGRPAPQSRRQEASSSDRRPIEPHPPRRNLPLLILSAALLLGFLIYLAAIAWTATR